jgi:hypothetical protein
MKKHYVRKGIAFVVIILFIGLAFTSIISGDRKISDQVLYDYDDDVELQIWGGFRFNVRVINHKSEPINCHVEIWMENFLGMINGLRWDVVVEPGSTHYEWNDCWPMPFYRINMSVGDGNKTLLRRGYCLLGFNVFFTKEISYNEI